MKSPLIIVFSAILFFINSCQTGNSQNTKTSLNPAEFEAKIKELPNAALVDVRTPEEFTQGHIANASNIDWNGSSFDQDIAKLDKTKPVLVYCLSGGRSASAAAKMRADGFKEVYELEGGIMKWRAANLPEAVEKTAAANLGMTMDQFNKLLETNKTVLIDFYADWCGPCKKMKPSLDAISKELADKVVVIRINVDENKQLSTDLKIDALPTLQVFKKKKMTWSNIGYIEKPEIIKHL